MTGSKAARWVAAGALIALLSMPATIVAKPKPKVPASPQTTIKITVNIDLLSGIFPVGRDGVLRYSNYGLSTEELALAFYFFSVTGRPVTDAEIRFIAGNRNWRQLSWYFGLPPILLSDGWIVFRRPVHPRFHVPVGMKEYRNERKGQFEEKISYKPGKYEYKYENNKNRISEKLTMTVDRYEYKYEDPRIEEKLTVNLRNYTYDYKFQNRRSNLEIKKRGTGRPITPVLFYQFLLQEQKKHPGFRF